MWGYKITGKEYTWEAVVSYPKFKGFAEQNLWRFKDLKWSAEVWTTSKTITLLTALTKGWSTCQDSRVGRSWAHPLLQIHKTTTIHKTPVSWELPEG